MKAKVFDISAFRDAIDTERKERGVSWSQIASETGVSNSTLSRMQRGKRPDADGLASLCNWAGITTIDPFICEGD